VNRTITIHFSADRHADLHGRAFAETHTFTSREDGLASAIDDALTTLGLEGEHAKAIITVDWPHE
jgi:hypothetical protein